MSDKKNIPKYLMELADLPLNKLLKKTNSPPFREKFGLSWYTEKNHYRNLTFISETIINHKDLILNLDAAEIFLLEFPLPTDAAYHSRLIIDFLERANRWNEKIKLIFMRSKLYTKYELIKQSFALQKFIDEIIPSEEKTKLSPEITLYLIKKNKLNIKESMNYFDEITQNEKISIQLEYVNYMVDCVNSEITSDILHEKLYQHALKNKLPTIFENTLLKLKEDKKRHILLHLKTNFFRLKNIINKYGKTLTDRESNILIYKEIKSSAYTNVIRNIILTEHFSKDRCCSFIDYVMNNYKNGHKYLVKELAFNINESNHFEDKIRSARTYLIKQLEKKSMFKEIREVIVPRSHIDVSIKKNDAAQIELANGLKILLESNFLSNDFYSIHKFKLEYFKREYLSFLNKENMKETNLIEQRPDIAGPDVIIDHIKNHGNLSKIISSLRETNYMFNIGHRFWIFVHDLSKNNLKEEKDHAKRLLISEAQSFSNLIESMLKTYKVSDIIISEIDD